MSSIFNGLLTLFTMKVLKIIRRQSLIVDVFSLPYDQASRDVKILTEHDYATGLAHHACWSFHREPPPESSYCPALPSPSTYRPV